MGSRRLFLLKIITDLALQLVESGEGHEGVDRQQIVVFLQAHGRGLARGGRS